jgi:hypothetical protein
MLSSTNISCVCLISGHAQVLILYMLNFVTAAHMQLVDLSMQLPAWLQTLLVNNCDFLH